MDTTLVLAALGLAFHTLVGVIAGRVLVRLTGSSEDNLGRAKRWVVYVFGLLLMIVYGFAAGYLVKALRNRDEILVSFAVVMLAACLITYLRGRDAVTKN